MDVRTFLNQWPTRAELAIEIGVSKDTVHKWAQRGSIPSEHHLAVFNAATRRGFTDDPLLIAKLHAPGVS